MEKTKRAHCPICEKRGNATTMTDTSTGSFRCPVCGNSSASDETLKAQRVELGLDEPSEQEISLLVPLWVE